jgi:D-sedoheptulose 7-phosphate isomerase
MTPLDRDYTQHTKRYLTELTRCIGDISQETITRITSAILTAVRSGKTIYLAGNGGSAANASHIACDLMNIRIPGISSDRKRLRVRSLSDNMAILTANANDVSYEDVFTEQLKGLIRKDDVLIALTASGDSDNIVRAIRYAKKMDAVTIGLLGFTDGGEVGRLVDHAVIVDSDVYGLCEDIQLIVAHMMVYSFVQAAHAKVNGQKPRPSHAKHTAV